MASGHGAGQAATDLAAALDLLTRADDPAGAAAALMLSALTREYGGEVELACELLERCVQLCEELDLPSVGARAWQLLGNARLELDDLEGARTALEQGVPAIVQMGDRFAMTIGLSSLAALAAKSGKPELALKLAGTAAAHEERNQVRCPAPLRRSLEEWLEPARSAVGSAAGKVFEQGRLLTPEDALALALDGASTTPRADGRLPALTRRESEVAVLVARGLTNREIADELFLSVRTVEVHVDRTLSKLGFRSRTKLAAWVHEGDMLREDT